MPLLSRGHSYGHFTVTAHFHRKARRFSHSAGPFSYLIACAAYSTALCSFVRGGVDRPTLSFVFFASLSVDDGRQNSRTSARFLVTSIGREPGDDPCDGKAGEEESYWRKERRPPPFSS